MYIIEKRCQRFLFSGRKEPRQKGIQKGKNVYEKVSAWLDEVLKQDIPKEVAGFCFNLYEDGDGNWSVELVGAERFDEQDEDWPCDEITDFDTRTEPLTWKGEYAWDRALEEIRAALTKYLEKGKRAGILKDRAGVGVGFVNGDVEILYVKR